MKKAFYLSTLAILMLVFSCSKDFTSVTVSYTKATPVYADLEDIRQTPLLGSAREISNPGKIFVSESLLLVGEENEGIHVFDNSNPEAPQNILFINIPGNKEFYVHNDQLYAESYYDMLKVDIAEISRPVLKSRVRSAFGSELLNDEGEAIIAFEFNQVTEKLDPDDDFYQTISANDVNYFDYLNQIIPESAVPSSFAGNGNEAIGSVNRIAFYNQFLYVLSSSNITAFKDEGSLELVSSNQLGWQMETIFPYDDKLFIGTQNSMEVFDLNDPAQPQHVSSFWHATSCDPVYPVDGVAYVTLRTGDFANCPGDENALVVLDITDINTPTQIQQIEMESPYGMTMIDHKLYVGEGANGLKVFDATYKTGLSLETWDRSLQAYDMIPHPTRTDILLIAGPEGLSQYSIKRAGSIDLLSFLPF